MKSKCGDIRPARVRRSERRAASSGETAPRANAECWRASRPVSRKTVLLMLKPEFFDSVGEADYHFCRMPECGIVYFDGAGGPCFTTQHLRVRVGLKEREEPIPLCYCFDFYKHDVRDEIARTGRTVIPQRIRALVKSGMCACAARNPSGSCCLGELDQTAGALMREHAGRLSDEENRK